MSDANTSNVNTYDARVRVIRAYNQPILEDFRAWLEQAGFSEKTVRSHVDNIDFFTHYLVYSDPLKKLDEADGSDVRMFFYRLVSPESVVGFREQREVVFCLVQEVFPVDGGNRSCLSGNC